MSSMKLKLLPILLLAGCATQSPKVVQAWESPAAEFPAICMQLRSDGALAFKGGFEFYNPGKWRQDGGRLTLTLGGVEPFPAEISKEQLRRHAGALAGYDAALRQLHYTVAPATDAIGLGGFNFYPAVSRPCR